MNLTKQDLLNKILELETRLNRLEGRPRGPITMTEARLARERGDNVTVEAFLRQEERRYSKGKDDLLFHGASAGVRD